MERFIWDAAAAGVKLIVFPELSVSGSRPEDIPCVSEVESIGGKTSTHFSALAERLGIWIIYGDTEIDDNKLYDSAYICAPSGDISTIRRVQTEKLPWAEAGNCIGLIDTPWGKIGVGVGEDILEYPETERIMIGYGTNIVISVSATARNVSNNSKSWYWYIKNRIDSISARDAVRVVFANRCDDGFPGGSCAAEPQNWNVETKYLIGDITSTDERLYYGEISNESIPEGAIALENNFVPRLFADFYKRIAEDQLNGIKYEAKRSADGPVVGLVKTTAKWGDVQANLAMMTGYIEEAAKKNVDILMFPETILQGYKHIDPAPGEPSMHERLAETVPGPSSDCIAEYAKKYSMYICFGLAERSGEYIYNSMAVICPDGRQYTYRKISPHGEENYWCEPGTEPLIIDTPWGKAGVIVCMDGHSEPEIARYYAAKGCSFILHDACTSGNRWYRTCRLLPYVDRDGMGLITATTTGTDGPQKRLFATVSYAADPLPCGCFDPETGAPVNLHGLAANEKDDQGLSVVKLDLGNVGTSQTLNARLYAKEYAALADKLDTEQTYLYDLWNSHDLDKIRFAVKSGLIKPGKQHRFMGGLPITKEELATVLWKIENKKEI